MNKILLGLLVLLVGVLDATAQNYKSSSSTYKARTYEEMLDPVQQAHDAHIKADNELNLLFQQARASFGKGDYQDALITLKTCERLNSRFQGNLIDEGAISYAAASCCYMLEDYEGARDGFLFALKAGYQDAKVHLDACNRALSGQTQQSNIPVQQANLKKDGSLSVEEFMKTTRSEVSDIGLLLRNKGYSLQYTKDYVIKDGQDSLMLIDIAWGYKTTYNLSTDQWEFLTQETLSFFKLLFDEGQIATIMYGFNDASIYQAFIEELPKYGYSKRQESIDTQKGGIIIEFASISSESKIQLKETTKKTFTYEISWVE